MIQLLTDVAVVTYMGLKRHMQNLVGFAIKVINYSYKIQFLSNCGKSCVAGTNELL